MLAQKALQKLKVRLSERTCVRAGGVLPLTTGLVLACGPLTRAQLPSAPYPLPDITVSYVSEVPWPADAGEANPLECWAKKLSADWAPPPTEINTRLNNLKPELSWDHLRKSALNGRAQIFVIQGYELLEQGTTAKLDALLTPARDGKAACAEFVVLRRKESNDAPRFTMSDLEDKQILVDRGGCGDLVYRWLETEILPDTGKAHRATFAEFYSAKSAAEAILSVYFGDAYACVVSRESRDQVFRTNPKGFFGKIEEVRRSPELLKYVIACRKEMEPAQRKEVIKSASAIRLDRQGTWTLTVPATDDLKNLTGLITRWADLLGGSGTENFEIAPPRASAGATDPKRAAGGNRITERGSQP